MRFGSKTLKQRAVSRDFANTRLAGKQYHLSFASLCLRPAPKQQFEFFFPPDKLRQAARV